MREHVGQRPVVLLGPDLVAILGIQKLAGDTDTISVLAHAAVEHRVHLQPLSDFADVDVFPFEREGGGAGCDPDVFNLGESRDELFREPFAEVLVRRIQPHVAKRQHGDRGLQQLGCRSRGALARAGRNGLAGDNQRAHQRLRGLVAVIGVLLEEFRDDAAQRSRDAAIARRRVVQNRVDHLDGRRAGERLRSDGHFVDHRPEREEIAAVIDRVAEQPFRRHVVGRPEDAAGRGEAAARFLIEVGDRRLFGESEVEQLHDAALGDEDIGGLHVTMNDTLLVRRVERIGDLDGNVNHFEGAQPSAGHAHFQRLTTEQFHGNEGAAFEFIDLIDGADMRVIERRRRLGFALELAERGGICGKRVRNELQRNRTAEPSVLGLVDHAHPACAEQLDDVIPRDRASNHRSRPNPTLMAPWSRFQHPICFADRNGQCKVTGH